jgi:hypothetical protein
MMGLRMDGWMSGWMSGWMDGIENLDQTINMSF